MTGTSKDGCDAEPAGAGTTDGKGAELDPLAMPDDASDRSNRSVPVPVGLPVGDAEYRALKERARKRRGPADRREESVAQEDGHGFKKGGKGTEEQ